MLKDYTRTRTPRGTSSLAPAPPWHYVGNALAVEFEVDHVSAAVFLPEGLELQSPCCAAYFIEWQYASETGKEYLDPINHYLAVRQLRGGAGRVLPIHLCRSGRVFNARLGSRLAETNRFNVDYKSLRSAVQGRSSCRPWRQVRCHAFRERPTAN